MFPDFENPPKIHFKPEKSHFWFTLKGPIILPDTKLEVGQNIDGYKIVDI